MPDALSTEYLRLLAEAEKLIPAFLQEPESWNTLDVMYEPPRVERLWRDIDDGLRLYLHRIHPCETALYHPHPWPSAIKIVSGRYEMGLGYLPNGDNGTRNPPTAALTVLAAGSSYAMTDPRGWHWVRPLGEPSMSVMITGPRWPHQWSPKPTHPLQPLSREDHHKLVRDFKQHYPG